MMLKFERSRTSIESELISLKNEVYSYIDETIGTIRLKFITDLPGQDSVYRMQEEEAIAYLKDEANKGENDPELDPSNYVAIYHQIGLVAPTAYEIAQLWVNKANLTRSEGAKIEALRQGAKNTVADATTKADIISARLRFDELVKQY